MPTGGITEYIDVAQIVLYVFWAFFAFLILYLRREDKREGYPLESDRSGRIRVVGWPSMPDPKVFALPHGGSYEAPNDQLETRPVQAEPTAPWPGAPLSPTGDPMLDGVGPGSYVERGDEPERTVHGEPRIVPMRVATDFSVEPRDPDPRGMEVVGADGKVGGTISDIWVDRAEPQIRYLEVEVPGPPESPGQPSGRRVLLPIGLANIDGRRRRVRVASIHSHHFARVPGLRDESQVSQGEEDRICGYYGGGTLYADPSRQEPLL